MAIVGTGKRCECCTERNGRERVVSGVRANGMVFRPDVDTAQKVKYVLCDRCAQEGHMRQSCMLCPAGAPQTVGDGKVWDCARMAHVQALHPGIIRQMGHAEEMERDYLKEHPNPEPGLKYLGTIYPDADPSLGGQ